MRIRTFGRAALIALSLSLASAIALPSLAPPEAVAAPKRKRTKPKPPARTRPLKAPPKPKTPEPPKKAAAPEPAPEQPFRGPTRIDFDDRLIQGQTNKSGAVYLFDRKETGIKSMVKRRKSFRHLTISTVYDEP